MFTQKKSAAKPAPAVAARKIHSLHALPDGKNFVGNLVVGKNTHQFTFAPRTAELSGGKLKLRGTVTVKSPNGQKRTAENVEALLLATQGSILTAPPAPTSLPDGLRNAQQADKSLPMTEATADLASVGVIYFKLSPLDGRALGVPAEITALQLNARLYVTSELERDLQWYYSGLVVAMEAQSDEPRARVFLAEINRVLQA